MMSLIKAQYDVIEEPMDTIWRNRVSFGDIGIRMQLDIMPFGDTEHNLASHGCIALHDEIKHHSKRRNLEP